MYQAYAEILGRYAADVVRKMSGLIPNRIEMTSDAVPVEPAADLSVEVDFTGRQKEYGPLEGHFLLSIQDKAAAAPLALAVAKKLGLDPGQADTDEGQVNIFSELLNIIIGLTGAGWSEWGLDIHFSPPKAHFGHTKPRPLLGAETYQIHLEAEDTSPIQLFICFRLTAADLS